MPASGWTCSCEFGRATTCAHAVLRDAASDGDRFARKPAGSTPRTSTAPVLAITATDDAVTMRHPCITSKASSSQEWRRCGCPWPHQLAAAKMMPSAELEVHLGTARWSVDLSPPQFPGRGRCREKCVPLVALICVRTALLTIQSACHPGSELSETQNVHHALCNLPTFTFCIVQCFACCAVSGTLATRRMFL